jgi:hypothetical protein
MILSQRLIAIGGLSMHTQEQHADPVVTGYKIFFALMGMMIAGSFVMAIYNAIRPLPL